MATPPPPPPALVVLDTNVVLDLWLFTDPRASPLRAALQAGQVQALVTAPMLAELSDVLQRDFARRRPGGPTAAQVLTVLRACSRQVDPPTMPASAPRCTDRDDQKFIDLALSWPATWLLSRDRAVLKLARAARGRGVQIGTPERWAAAQGAD